jgi:hypothetical protein
MSYLACHIQKFKAQDLRGMEIHNERESKNSKNKDIDYSRTNQNYDALGVEGNIKYRDKVENVIESQYGGNKAIRKDAVKMVSVLITSDRDFFKSLEPNKQREFFKTSAEWLKDRYGAENVVSAKVHMDEITPHMHFCLVPMRDGKLTAKTIFNRKELLALQKELPAYLKERGFDIERGIEGSEIKHVPTDQFKKDHLQQLQEIYKISEKNFKEKTMINENTCNSLEDRIDDIRRNANYATKMGVFEDKSKVILPSNKFWELVKMAKEGVGYSTQLEKNKVTTKALGEYKEAYLDKYKNPKTMRQLENENRVLQREKTSLENTAKTLRDKLEKVFEKAPQLRQELAKDLAREKLEQMKIRNTSKSRDWGRGR